MACYWSTTWWLETVFQYKWHVPSEGHWPPLENISLILPAVTVSSTSCLSSGWVWQTWQGWRAWTCRTSGEWTAAHHGAHVDAAHQGSYKGNKDESNVLSFFESQGARGFPGTPGLPGIKGHRVSDRSFTATLHKNSGAPCRAEVATVWKSLSMFFKNEKKSRQ